MPDAGYRSIRATPRVSRVSRVKAADSRRNGRGGWLAADLDRLRRFEREARTLAALNHPNIAQVFGVLEAPAALVMEFVDGEDLSQRIARGPIPMEEGLLLAQQIAQRFGYRLLNLVDVIRDPRHQRATGPAAEEPG